MTQPTSKLPSDLTPAERAEAVIKAAHLDTIYTLEAPPKRSGFDGQNEPDEVWFYGPYVVRIHPKGSGFAREATLLRYLSTGVPHSTVITSGDSWLIQRRLPGNPLRLCWEGFDTAQKRAAAQQLAAILINLHQTRVSGMPSLSPGWFTAILPTEIAALTARLKDQAGGDGALMDAVAHITRKTMVKITPPLRWGFIHRALNFDRILWHEDRITALLDFGSAIYAPRELELEALLRDDPPMLKTWLKEDYPLLLNEEGLDQRLRLYGIERDLRRLSAHPDDQNALAHLRTMIEAE